jgi:RNA polymerase I-specific transcription initiation factor RRN6
MGNFAFEEPLTEDMTRYRNADDLSTERPLFAIGSVPDYTNLKFSRQVTLLAAATGESGELLRLAASHDTRWQWGESRDAFLNLSVVDPVDREEETTWASDGLPITQVKYVEGLSNQDYVRWIIVQKQTSTTVLQPEYHPIPLSTNQPKEASSHYLPSHVQPHPVVTLQHSETGGNAHSDVAFSPAAFGHDPMLAIIDECGYWSIWDVLGTWRPGLKTTRLSLRLCGQIDDGILANFSQQASHPASKHGLVAVPNRNGPFFSETSPGKGPWAMPPGPTLLMWRSDKLMAIDMHTGENISPLKKFWNPSDRSRQIIDIQRCLVFEGRVFILTERSILWIEVGAGEREPNLKTILACTHSGTVTDDAKLTLCRVSGTTIMAFIFSNHTGQLSAYWFENNGPAGFPQWQRYITSIPAVDDFQPNTRVHQISVMPAKLSLNGEALPSGLGTFYYQEGVEFYQVNILGEDLSMRYGIYTTSCNTGLSITLPTKRLGGSMTEQRKRWKKKRKTIVRHFGTAFVLPDGVTDSELSMMLARNQNSAEEILPHQELIPKPGFPVRLKLERFCRRIMQKMNDSLELGERGLPRDLFEAIQDMFSEGSRLPLLTWHELFNKVGGQAILDPISNGMEREVEALVDQTDDSKVIAQVRRFGRHESPETLIRLRYVYRELCDMWLEPSQGKLSPRLQDQRKVWVAEIARDLFLSSYAVMIQDVPVLGVGPRDGANHSTAPFSSAMPPSSPASIRSTPPATSPSKSRSDGAIDRLRLLAGSMEPGELGTTKSIDLLSYWPSKRGIDTQGYISSVSLATDDKFREARERLQRKEARLKSHVDKFRRMSAKRQSVGPNEDAVAVSPRPPPMQIMSSQQMPSSSQTQGASVPPLTMSQPTSGAFGDRKKTKKPKRKSGFR